jgi:diguanylate cyclase (GGDEF)-like protein/PAS domain S-box-containing protein
MAGKRKIKEPADNTDLLIRHYESLVHSAKDIILFVRHSDGQIMEANTAALNMYQYSHEELLTKTIFDLRAPETSDQIMTQMNNAAYSGMLIETIHLKKDGERFPVEVNSQGAIIGNEQILLSIVRDITERKRAEQRLQESESNLLALLNAVTESFFLIDRDGTVLAANETIARRFSVGLDKLIGSSIYSLLPPDIALQRKMQVEQVMRSGKPIRFEDIRFDRHIDQVFYPVFNDKEEVVRVAVFGMDITEHRKMEQKLETMAFTDQLTGLYNRRGFVHLTERQLKLSRRSKHRMLLFYADLDGMKWINDNFGHEEGDKALISAAKILIKTFRESDIVSRIGGDEFAILAVNADEKVSDSLINRFHKFIDHINSRKRKKHKLSISIGFAAYDPDHPCPLDELMCRADISMYEDKKLNKAAGQNLPANK